MFEVDKVYKLTDARPPAFGKVMRVTTQNIWNEIFEDNDEVRIAWGTGINGMIQMSIAFLTLGLKQTD